MLHKTEFYTSFLNKQQALLDWSERAATPAGTARAERPRRSASDEEIEAVPAESVRPEAEIPADMFH